VKIVNLPGLPEGGDVVEFIAARPNATPEQIRAEIEALANAERWIEPSSIIGGPVLVTMADVEPVAVKWLWFGRIPLGRITLLVGRPGEGKSFLTMYIAAVVSNGGPWPDGSGNAPRGPVLMICIEDDAGDTIRTRLDSHYANVSQIHLMTMVRRIGEDGKPHDVCFTLADLHALEQAIEQIRPVLVIIDPIGSVIGGKTDAHRDNEVRAVLAPVAALAAKYGCAVLIVAHRRKSDGDVADDLAMGSRAFTGIARAVWHLSRERVNPARRLLLSGKMNLSAESSGLAFTSAAIRPAFCGSATR